MNGTGRKAGVGGGFVVWVLLTAAAFGCVASAAAAAPASPGGESQVAGSPSGEETDAEDASAGDGRIVGGKRVPYGKYRFIAAVRDVRQGSTVYTQQYCAGTLIDQNAVLTAAHCLEERTAGQLRVTVGITALNRNQGQTRRVARIFRHPRYTRAAVSYRYDAAVLKLRSPVTGIVPVTLPLSGSNGFERPGRSLTIAGWGNTVKQSPGGGEQDNFPYYMREAEVPVVRDDAGKRVYGPGYAPSLMVAAGREGKDSCQGDSGGPLFERADSGRYQVGITSFGAGCGSRGFPGVYAEVNASSIRTFIVSAARR